MHPEISKLLPSEVEQDTPGRCPKCSMNLVEKQNKLQESAEHASHGTLYTCPMDPEVVKNEPGRCPKCGMQLEPMHKEDHGGYCEHGGKF